MARTRVQSTEEYLRDRCCLCGRTRENVEGLILGVHGAVCIGCIDLSHEIIHKSPEDRSDLLAEAQKHARDAQSKSLINHLFGRR